MINAINAELNLISNKEIGDTLENVGIKITYNAGEFDGKLRHARINAPSLPDEVTIVMESFYGPEDAVFDIMDEIRKLTEYNTPYLKNKLGVFLDGEAPVNR